MNEAPNDNVTWLLCNIEDERLRRLFPEVWARIPERDRASLKDVLKVSDVNHEMPKSLLAGCVWRHIQDDFGKYEIHINFDSDITDSKFSDKQICFLIAHEIAHAVLRHGRFLNFIARKRLPDNARANIEALFEDAAHVQLLDWGFEKEMIEMFAFDSAAKPKWFDINGGNDTRYLPQ